MWRTVTVASVSRILPAWLGFALGGVTAAIGDMRGWVALTVVGFAVAIPCFIVLFVQVYRILYPPMRD